MNKIVQIIFVVVVALLTTVGCSINSNQNKSVTIIEFRELEAQKALIKQKDEEAVEAYIQLLKEADLALTQEAFSVVNKTGVPPSGDKHDYMTIGPYWWPNPDTPDGLPYIRKDGEVNPETRNNFTDFVELQAFFNSIVTLRDAYYFSENKAYAEKAVFLIKAWFLDEATKMNPNINYGQSVPGEIDGRKFAIIEFEKIKEVIKCLELLSERNVLATETEQQMKAWLSEYAYWLQNSENGKGEANTENNHGTHYDGQLLSILTYLGRIDEVKEYLSTISKNRIFSQIEPDGSQPLELARTKSFSYSVMNLHGFLYLARLGQKVGVDLWNTESEDGRSIKKGFEYMLPYLTQEKIWEHKQIIDADYAVEKLIRDLKFAQKIFKDDVFDRTLEQFENEQVSVLFEKQNN